MKKIKIILSILILIVILIAALGVYRFNFTNDDIYIVKTDGDVIKYDDVKVKDIDKNISTSTTISIDKMNLYMKKWIWEKTIYNDGKIIISNKPGDFSLTFGKDSKVFIDTDCNNMSGQYKVTTDKKIVIDNLISTMMYCEGSKEQDFSKMISEVSSFMFTEKGELVLMMKYDTGSIILR